MMTREYQGTMAGRRRRGRVAPANECRAGRAERSPDEMGLGSKWRPSRSPVSVWVRECAAQAQRGTSELFAR
ncbi:unnamed protein product, partial [Iphiclides podalirius]